MPIEEMAAAHPNGAKNTSLIRCVEACVECAQACTACADACLAETDLEMLRRCIRLNLDCADICSAAAAIATRQTEPSEELVRSVLESCALACRICGDECKRHASHHPHCRICMETCESCLRACQEALQTLGGALH